MRADARTSRAATVGGRVT